MEIIAANMCGNEDGATVEVYFMGEFNLGEAVVHPMVAGLPLTPDVDSAWECEDDIFCETWQSGSDEDKLKRVVIYNIG